MDQRNRIPNKRAMKNITHFILIGLFILLSSCDSNDSESVNPSTDISNPGGSPFNPISNSGQGGSLARFSIVNDIMYYVDHSTIKVFDIEDPKKPTLVTTENIFTNDVETIFHSGDYLYLGSSNGMFIYSISNPLSPQYLSMATHVSGCDPVVSDGEYAYVTVRNTQLCNRNVDINILEIYDVTNPASPVFISRTAMTEPVGLAIENNTLFVCDKGIKIFDVTEKSNPILTKVIPSNAYDIIINGDTILTVGSDGISQYYYDRKNLSLILLSTITTI